MASYWPRKGDIGTDQPLRLTVPRRVNYRLRTLAYSAIDSATASATLMPSTPADKIPPA